jgi:hypothetical protein
MFSEITVDSNPVPEARKNTSESPVAWADAIHAQDCDVGVRSIWEGPDSATLVGYGVITLTVVLLGKSPPSQADRLNSIADASPTVTSEGSYFQQSVLRGGDVGGLTSLDEADPNRSEAFCSYLVLSCGV